MIIKTEFIARLFLLYLPQSNVLVFNGEKVIFKQIPQINVNDQVLIPRHIRFAEIPETATKHPDLLTILDDLYGPITSEFIEQVRTAFLTAREKLGSFDAVYEQLGDFKMHNPSVPGLLKLSKLSGIEFDLSKLRPFNYSDVTPLPDINNRDFLDLLGLYVSDGLHHKGRKFGISNADRTITERWVDILKSIFDFDSKIKIDKLSLENPNHQDQHVTNKKNAVVGGLLERLTIPGSKYEHIEKSHHVRIPNYIFFLDKLNSSHFLNGYIAGDGHFDRRTIGLTTTSDRLKIDLTYLLSIFGIVYTASPKNRSGKQIGWVITFHGDGIRKISDIFRLAEIYNYEKTLKIHDWADQTVDDPNAVSNKDKIFFSDKLLDEILNIPIFAATHPSHPLRLKIMEVKRNKRGITPKKLQSWTDAIKGDSSSLDEESASTLETLEQVSNILKDFYIDKVVKIESETDKQHLYALELDQPVSFLLGGSTPTLISV